VELQPALRPPRVGRHPHLTCDPVREHPQCRVVGQGDEVCGALLQLFALGLQPGQVAAPVVDPAASPPLQVTGLHQHLELLTGVGLQAGLSVPMIAGGKIIGALSLISAESARRFTDADVALAEEIARRAGTAVENARLYTERSNIARTLQTSLLPRTLPDMPGWAAATLYRPAGDENWVGGDFYARSRSRAAGWRSSATSSATARRRPP